MADQDDAAVRAQGPAFAEDGADAVGQDEAERAVQDAMQDILKEEEDGGSLDLLPIDDDEDSQSIDAAFDPRIAEMITPAGSHDLAAVYNVPVRVTAVLGVSKVRVADLLRMRRGTVIELDRKVGEAIDIYVNDRLIARGEVVVVDNHLGITMTEIIKTDQN